ncbi:MAG: choice-of-anchor D domain-containing protein [Salinivirgaceae bacterium]
MKINRKLVFLILANVTAILYPVRAQWNQTGGPAGGTAHSLTVSGTNLYAKNFGEVLISENNASSWSKLNVGISGTYIDYFYAKDSNLLAFTTGSGLYISNDNGTTWSPYIWTKILGSYQVASCAVKDSAIFAGTLQGGVYLSTDNGINWLPVNNGLTDTLVETLAVIDTKIFAGTKWGGVFVSSNNGTSWTATNTGLTNLQIYSLIVKGTTLFAGTWNGGVFKSENYGANWVELNNGISGAGMTVHSLTLIDTTIYAFTEGDNYVSSNNGATWNVFPKRVSDFEPINSIAGIGSNLFAGTAGGVYLSTNNGVSWSAANNGLFIKTSVSYISKCRDSLYVATTSGFYYSPDEGAHWTSINSDLVSVSGSTRLLFLSIIDTTFYAGMYQKGLFKSTNRGVNWTPANTGFPNYWAMSVSSYGSNLYAGNSMGVFVSTDNGDNWVAINTGMETIPVHSVVMKDNFLFAATYQGVYRSADDGASWTQENTGLAYTEISNLTVIGTDIYAGTNNGIYRSSDNGSHWSAINTGLYGQNCCSEVTATAVSDTILFLGMNAEVYYSKNKGANWIKASTGLAKGRIQTLFVDGANIYTGVGAEGVYKAIIKSLIIPEAPQNLLVTNAKNHSVTIKWNKNSEGNFLRYRIYGGLYGYSMNLIDSTLLGVTDTTITIQNLNNRKEYWFNVAAVDSYNNQSTFSNLVSCTIVDTETPDEPIGDSIISTSRNNFAVRFKKNSSNDVLRYRVYFGMSAGSLTRKDSVSNGINDTIKVFHGLVAGTTYFVGVSAVDSSLNESTMEVISATGTHTIQAIYNSANSNIEVERGKLGDSIEYSFSILNSGDDTLKIYSIISTDSSFIPKDSVFIIPDGVAQKNAKFLFAPNKIGVNSGDIIINSNAITGHDTIHIQGFGYGEGKLSLASKFIDFGWVLVGKSKDSIITWENVGNDTLKIDAINGVNYEINIPPGQSINDTLTINASQRGNLSYNKIIHSNSTPVTDTIVISGYGYFKGILSLEQSIVYFGNVKVGDTLEYSFPIKNLGDDSLKIAIASSDAFVVPIDTELMLLPGYLNAANAKFLFFPQTIGDISADIYITSEVNNQKDTVHISAFGYGEGILSCDKTIDLGQILVNQPIDTIIKLSNTGNDTLRIKSINYDNELRLIPPGEYIDYAYTYNLPPGQLGVFFSNIVIQIRINNFEITETTETIILSGYVYGIGVMNVDPITVDFGIVNMNIPPSEQNIITKNVGTDTIKISNIESTNNQFEVNDGYLKELAPNQFSAVGVLLKASEIGAISGKIIITSNSPLIYDTVDLTAFVKGIADIESNISSINFGYVPQYNTKDTTFTLTNVGNDTLFIEQFSFNNNTVDGVLAVMPAPMTIPVGLSQEYTLSFTPDDVRTWEAVLKVHSNASNFPLYSIDITGNSNINSIEKEESKLEKMRSYPNPFINTITLEYYIPFYSNVQLAVYDISGKEIAILEDTEKTEGLHHLVWDGKNGLGIPVERGIYLLTLETVDFKGNNRPQIVKNILIMKQ